MKISELIQLADSAYYAAQYDKAVELYEKILERVPKNKYAQKQLKKAEFKRSLEMTVPNLPTEALELYRRARSFITAKDLPQAKKLLKEAIAIAKKSGKKFPQAQELFDNLPNAYTADGFKQNALQQLDLKQWAKALDHLNNAVNLDPTDEVNQKLLSHLNSLIKAQGLLSQLNAGVRNRKIRQAIISEIQKITESTNELPVLSTLWQDVVRQFGEYNNRGKQNSNLIRNVIWWSFGVILLLTGFLSVRYLLPDTQESVDCSKSNGLVVTLTYPDYIANGDKTAVAITIKNVSADVINGHVLLDFGGTAKVYFESKEANRLLVDNLGPLELRSAKVMFLLDEPFGIFSNPDDYINFKAYVEGNGSICSSDEFQISLAPLYGIRKILWSVVALTLLGLFGERIRKFLG